MKIQFALLIGAMGISAMAEPVVIHQPGLIEGMCNTAFGTVRCVGEFASSLVCGNTVVVNSPAPVAVPVVPVAVMPAAPVPVVVHPAPVVVYGGHYGYSHQRFRRGCYRPCHHPRRPCHPCYRR